MFLNDPARVVIAVGLIVLAVEFSIMLLISGFAEGSFLEVWYFVDPILLTALVSPALYVLIFRPMRNQQAELERQLVESRRNEQLTALIEAIPDAVFLKDGEGRWLITNEPAKQLFQLHDLSWQGKTDMELADLHLAFRAAHEECLASDEKAWQAGRLLVGEESVVGEDGRCAIMEARKMPMFGTEGQRKGLAIIGRDVTGRKAAEARIERLSKLYQALRGVNQAIMRMDDESALFPRVCRIAVDFGGVRMAWIGRSNAANGLIEPVASYGGGVEYLDGIVISSKQDVPEGCGPSAIAFRENRNVVVNSFQMSEMTKPWHERALRYDLKSSGSFPIPRAGKPFAVFSVYHSYPGAFDAEMIGLLDEMSHDISFALDNFDRESERKRMEKALKESEERYRRITEGLTDYQYTVRVENGRPVGTTQSPACVTVTGYMAEEYAANPYLWIQMVVPEDRERVMQHVQRILAGQDVSPIEHRITRKNGETRWISDTTILFRDAPGKLLSYDGVIKDITERKQAEQELRIAATTFETQEGIVITDRDTRILRVNHAFTRLTGYSAEEAIGQTPAMLHSGQQDAEFYRSLWETITRDKYWQGEIWNRRKDGVVYPEWLTVTAVTDADGQVTHYVGVFVDITQRKKAEEQIHQLVFYDSLTRLPNRSLLVDRLQQAVATGTHSGQHGALLFLNLDHFKIVNDTQGHDIGDLLLIEVARRLQSCVRESDSVARLGGDEFAVILETLSVNTGEAAVQAELVAEKIRIALNHPYQLKKRVHHSTPSIGISLFRSHEESVEDLFKHADIAMYQAKTAGRNAIRFYDPAIQAAMEVRAELENELHEALEKQQFRLHYQIQVDSLHRPLGAEVLLRWEHPERGLVSPAQFIPLAEETGLIVPIGLWVLQTACSQLNAWQHDALARGLILAVNVSAKQFRQADFVAQVQRVLMESGAPPSHLKLEVTESVVLENIEDVITKMHAVKQFGVSFSMDDFGTGYSSLQYLKRLPLDQVKIDQSFMRDIASDPNDAAMVKTIIAMANALGLNVIAEGVETEAQREFLELHDCHAFQGYLFSKPVPLDEFERLLKRT